MAAKLAEECACVSTLTGPTQVCGDTAPSVVPGIEGHFQPSGIELNVEHQVKQIPNSIAQYRFVTAVKQVADLVMAPIIIPLSIAGLDSLHVLLESATLLVSKSSGCGYAALGPSSVKTL
jgi:hypothetical protein